MIVGSFLFWLRPPRSERLNGVCLGPSSGCEALTRQWQPKLLCAVDQTLVAPNAALLQTTCRWCGIYGGTGCCCPAFPHYLSSRQRWSDSASHPDLLCDDFMQVSLQSLLWICISNTFEPAGWPAAPPQPPGDGLHGALRYFLHRLSHLPPPPGSSLRCE